MFSQGSRVDPDVKALPQLLPSLSLATAGSSGGFSYCRARVVFEDTCLVLCRFSCQNSIHKLNVHKPSICICGLQAGGLPGDSAQLQPCE